MLLLIVTLLLLIQHTYTVNFFKVGHVKEEVERALCWPHDASHYHYVVDALGLAAKYIPRQTTPHK